MAFTHEVHPARQLGIVAFTGTIHGPEIVDAIETLFTDPRWEPGYAGLWDLRDVRVFAIAPGDVDAIVATTRGMDDRIGSGRAAIVARRHLDRSIAVLVSRRLKDRPDRETATFERFDEALAWLGLEQDEQVVDSS